MTRLLTISFLSNKPTTVSSSISIGEPRRCEVKLIEEFVAFEESIATLVADSLKKSRKMSAITSFLILVQKHSVMAAITRYAFKYIGRPLFVDDTRVATMTLRFTCKCGGAISILLNWSEGEDKFKKTDTCGACGEVLKMREVPRVLSEDGARIAVEGHFTIANTTIIDGDVTWKAYFYGRLVVINTVNEGEWELDEATFNEIATEQADKVRADMPGDLEDDDSEEEVKEEVEEDSNDDSDNSDTRDWKNIKDNMEQEEEDWLEKREKREERLEKRRKKREEERKKKMEEIDKIMECKPFSVTLRLLVEEVKKKKGKRNN
ncbi:hypothetical protein L2E82_34265 [Cichorium intybus]|uniref:Uncharacterized protein n=1 Tax=Cichorium intybus TaxID=13427 RepID=A0ACB9BLW1_CICIN|nr:hypothetical protein L2E82_34265 [Cichorium intybus]